MKTQRKKHSRLWVYLLYLGLVTSLILSVTLAKYASVAGGTGTATVAAMAGEVEAAPIEMPLEGLTPGGAPKTLTFAVVNYSGGAVSEVALDYDITVTTTGNLPLTFTLAAGTAENTVTLPVGGEILTAGKTQTLTGGSFPLAADGTQGLLKQSHPYTLTVTWPGEKSEAGYAHEIDLVTVKVAARQRLENP